MNGAEEADLAALPACSFEVLHEEEPVQVDPSRPADFPALFAGAVKAVRQDALYAAEDIPPKVDRLAVRRVLAHARHQERIHRLLVRVDPRRCHS
jgi:hypothetical protein